MNDQTLFALCIFGVVALAIFGLFRLFNGDRSGRVRERLSGKTQEEKPQAGAKIKEFAQKIGSAAAQPFMPDSREKQSALRRKLGMAGIYAPVAIRMVKGCSVISMGVGLLIGWGVALWMNNYLLGIAGGGLVGYLAPTIWLRLRIGSQQKALEYGLPDALDLMVVCVEAGLAVDAAMQRVGQELSLVHPSLSRELEIAHMETRVGLSRAESLRNLGLRTGSPPLQGLGSMLIQAERFGTSVAQALRVHAESLRMVRQHKAEEMAAKAAVKMSFPLVLFIFPATFIILAGPTIVGMMHSSFFNS
jgi:tight adherence protein C